MFVIRLLGRLPLWILYLVADIFYLINYYLIGYRKDIILKNLKLVFPDRTEKDRRDILKQFYHNLSDIMVETVKGLYISEEELLRRVKYENIEIIESAKRSNQNVVLLTAHQCNWEWALQSASIQFPMKIHGIYKPLTNAGFDNLIYQIRTRFGGSLISKDRVVRNIIENKENTRIIGIIGDQRPMLGMPKYWSKMFGMDTAFFPGLEQIPKMTNGITVFVKLTRIKRGFYRNEIVKIAEPPYENDKTLIIEKYIDAMEEMIKEAPANWLWSHNRWKYGKEESGGK